MANAPSNLRSRRLTNEWRLLGELAALNSDMIHELEWKATPPLDSFFLQLKETPGITGTSQVFETQEHGVELRFPRFFPAVPLELYLDRPVFHPNVEPETGFVCLWDRHSPRCTVIEALVRLQATLAWRMVNLEDRHVMQPTALRHLSALPISYRKLVLNPKWRLQQETGQCTGRRRRISDAESDQ